MNYIFNNLYGTDRPWAAADYRIADELSDYVVNFATTGNPNRGHRRGRPNWPTLRPASPTVMEVGDAFHPITAADSPAKYQFIKRFACFGRHFNPREALVRASLPDLDLADLEIAAMGQNLIQNLRQNERINNMPA